MKKTNVCVTVDGDILKLSGYILGGCFAANKEVSNTGDRGPWNITHTPTGYKVGTVRTLKQARCKVDELNSMWNGWASNDTGWIREHAPSNVRSFCRSLKCE